MNFLKPFVILILGAPLYVSGCASVNTFVVLLPEEGGTTSAVTVARTTDERYSTSLTALPPSIPKATSPRKPLAPRKPIALLPTPSPLNRRDRSVLHSISKLIVLTLRRRRNRPWMRFWPKSPSDKPWRFK